MNANLPELPEETNFSSRKEFRIYDRINFRLRQEILVRDDEIKRLKKRLESIKLIKLKGNSRKAILSNKDFEENNILAEQLANLRKQIFIESSKAEMKLTNSSIQHSQKISKMNQKFNEEVQELKQTLYQIVSSNNFENSQASDEESAQVEQFLNSLRNIISSKNKKDINPKNENPSNFVYYEDKKNKNVDESIFSDSRNFDMHLYNEEIQDNEQRINQIRQLIKKYQSNSSLVLGDTRSDYYSQNAKSNYETEISLNGSQNNLSNSSIDIDNSNYIQTQARIQKLVNEHKKQVELLQKKIRKEKKNALLKQRKIEIATSQSFLTDAEIAETMKVQEKIKKKKEKKNSLRITIESLSEMTIQQREELLSRLKIENITLKREIVRVDYVAYGRTGKYQRWKKLDDDALFQCTMLYFQ